MMIIWNRIWLGVNTFMFKCSVIFLDTYAILLVALMKFLRWKMFRLLSHEFALFGLRATPSSSCIITARIRRLGKVIFSSVRSHLQGEGYPHPANGRGYPCPGQDGGIPLCRSGWAYPLPDRGVPHPSWWGIPLLGLNGGTPHWDWMGVPPVGIHAGGLSCYNKACICILTGVSSLTSKVNVFIRVFHFIYIDPCRVLWNNPVMQGNSASAPYQGSQPHRNVRPNSFHRYFIFTVCWNFIGRFLFVFLFFQFKIIPSRHLKLMECFVWQLNCSDSSFYFILNSPFGFVHSGYQLYKSVPAVSASIGYQLHMSVPAMSGSSRIPALQVSTNGEWFI